MSDFVEERLAQYEREYKRGNRRTLLFAMADCALLHYPPPTWVRDAYTKTLRAMTIGDSWDDIFGPLQPKGSKKVARRRYYRILGPVIGHINTRPKGTPIDRDLFEEIGKKPDVGASGATVERAYAEYRRAVRASLGVNPQKTRK